MVEGLIVRYKTDNKIINSTRVACFENFHYATYFNFFHCNSLHSGHLEQLAFACPNLQRLKLNTCFHCLESLQGLQAIASRCHNLQGLNLLGICVSKVKDNVLLWKILSDMKLTHLAVQFCVLRSKSANKKMLVCLYRKCAIIKGIQCEFCASKDCTIEDALMLSYFSSLNYCYLQGHINKFPTIVQTVINNCKKLRCAFSCHQYQLSLSLAHNHYLQLLFIFSPYTNVPDDFMTSVSAHCGLVHVVMKVGSLTVEGITSLVRNSPELITLHLCTIAIDHVNVKKFDTKLKLMFRNRKLFTVGHYMVDLHWIESLSDVLWEQGTDLLLLWNM